MSTRRIPIEVLIAGAFDAGDAVAFARRLPAVPDADAERLLRQHLERDHGIAEHARSMEDVRLRELASSPAPPPANSYVPDVATVNCSIRSSAWPASASVITRAVRYG